MSTGFVPVEFQATLPVLDTVTETTRVSPERAMAVGGASYRPDQRGYSTPTDIITGAPPRASNQAIPSRTRSIVSLAPPATSGATTVATRVVVAPLGTSAGRDVRAPSQTSRRP